MILYLIVLIYSKVYWLSSFIFVFSYFFTDFVKAANGKQYDPHEQ